MDLIIDCYTDEPSGLGVPPYLSVHSRYLAGALYQKGIDYSYINIDDLRHINGEQEVVGDSLNKRVINGVAGDKAQNYLDKSDNIYVVMGCFVNYVYLSCEPPSFTELNELLKNYKSKNLILMYALGSKVISKDELRKTLPEGLFKTIVFGNVYNYILTEATDDFNPYYDKLKNIAISSADIIDKLRRPLIMEIESQTGCNRKPGCTFCIESIRGLPNTSRDVDDITAEIKALYDKKIRNFRIGRQPNFYSYQDSSPEEIERLFRGIWNECPELRTLHIDNVSPHNVITSKGRQVSELVAKYCTSGNIGSFGIESFDVRIREINNLNGTIAEIHKAIRILNEVGSQQGEQGTRIFLPGINIIYGLEGQSDITLSENFKHFDSILGNYYVRRVFVRNLTSPHGKQFGENQFKESLDEWKRQITERFSLPMLKKVYPLGTILKNERVEMVENGNSILRQMGTCPEKIVLKNKKLNLDDFYTVKITGYRNDRTMEGEILCKE